MKEITYYSFVLKTSRSVLLQVSQLRPQRMLQKEQVT